MCDNCGFGIFICFCVVIYVGCDCDYVFEGIFKFIVYYICVGVNLKEIGVKNWL